MATDPFSNVRKQAQRALDAALREIRRREEELAKLVAQADQWRLAIADTKPTARPVARRTRAKAKRTTGKKRSGKRTNWETVLKGLPAKFTVDDVMKRPGVKARGRSQVYPTLTRWMESKKVRRVGKGKYQKL